MSDSFSRFAERCLETRPEVFLVLGSGLGIVADRVEAIESAPFSAIQGLPTSSVQGHKGRWTLGRWAGRVVLLSEGRIHYYEGHPWEIVVRPMQIAAEMGVRYALVTNAAGGIRDDLQPGSLMPIVDHLEWNKPNPWREPRGLSPYSRELLDRVVRAGKAMGMTLTPGVYGAVTGPSYETPAEIRALRIAGADAVGMSTSREVQAGQARGVECAAVSLITNRAAGLSKTRLSHEEVIAAGKAAANRLADLIERTIRSL
jgi:purine-nucleoside phosphorylase